MAGFEKYIDKRTIEKKVDPTLGLPVAEVAAPRRFLETQQTAGGVDAPKVESTSPQTLVRDISTLAVEVRETAARAISEIEAASSSDPVFSMYARLAKEAVLDPYSGTGTKALVTPHTLRALERDAYQRITDPRAPFLRDLYRVRAQAGSLLRSLEEVWSIALKANGLYRLFTENSLTRISLLKTRQRLDHMNQYAKDVRALSPISLSKEFFEEAADWFSAVREHAAPVEAILERSHINSCYGWTHAHSVVEGLIGDDLYADFDQRAIGAQAHGALCGLDPLANYGTLLERAGLQGEAAAQLAELKAQVDDALFELMALSETELLSSESLFIQENEARELMRLAALKGSYAKAYLEAAAALRALGPIARDKGPLELVKAVSAAAKRLRKVALKPPVRKVVEIAEDAAGAIEALAKVVR